MSLAVLIYVTANISGGYALLHPVICCGDVCCHIITTWPGACGSGVLTSIFACRHLNPAVTAATVITGKELLQNHKQCLAAEHLLQVAL